MKCSTYIKKFVTLVKNSFGEESKDESKELSLDDLEKAIKNAELLHLKQQTRLLRSQIKLSWVSLVAKLFLIPLIAWVFTNLDMIQTIWEKL